MRNPDRTLDDAIAVFISEKDLDAAQLREDGSDAKKLRDNDE